MKWDSHAKNLLHDHVSKSTNTDPSSDEYQDLLTDLTAHIEEELHQKKIQYIDSDSVRNILLSMGYDEFNEIKPNSITSPASKTLICAESSSQHGHNNSTYWPNKYSIFKTFCVWFFTIIIPSAALITELSMHASRGIFFDPIPKWINIVLIAIVPITFLKLYFFHLKYKENDPNNANFLKVNKFLLGFIFPIILYYVILFIPVTPIALIGCIFLLGFLPLAPLFCLIGWVFSLNRLKNIDNTLQVITKKWLPYGLAGGMTCLIAVESPSYLAQNAIADATSEDVATKQKGIKNIRFYGGEDTLLYLCYHGEGRGIGNGSTSSTAAHWVYRFLKQKEITVDEARSLYYQVTGNPFNSMKPNESMGGRDDFLFDEFTWDADHGGDDVAGRTKGLSLHSSRMDLHIDDVSKLGYAEWIIEFKNMNPLAKEARMQIALPHQGFVSKLSLWVHGEERPASFSTVNKVKAAYQEIAVAQRQDPVLVNVSGKDRVMLQCFPVPANGGIMKMKVGITFPLMHTAKDSGNVYFPYIAERNFSIFEELKHEIYAQSDLKIKAYGANHESNQKFSTLQYSLRNQLLKTERLNWIDTTPKNNEIVYTIDKFHKGSDKYLKRSLKNGNQIHDTETRKVMIVVDSSKSMEKWKSMISKIFEHKNITYELYVTGNHEQPLRHCTSLAEFQDIDFVGGVDNIHGLRKALSLAKENSSTATSILWIHGSQPIKFPSINGLEQDLERSLTKIPIYNVSLEEGANHILQTFKRSPHFHGEHRVSNEAELIQSLNRVHHSKSQYQSKYTWSRTNIEPTDMNETWDNLAQSWAYEIAAQNLENSKTRANNIPAQYEIVSVSSGAIVLETDQQYIDTGLDIPNAEISSSIPVVPEPSTTLTVLIGLMALTIRRSR